MSPHLQRVAEVGANGRVYVGIGLIVMVVIVLAVALMLRRKGNDR